MSSPLGVAVVTGAGQGIGLSIALRLAHDGYDVALSDISSNEEKLNVLSKQIVEKGRNTCIITADVTKEEEVANMVFEAVNKLGSLDIMVANAGICRTKSLVETSAEDWDNIFAVNARGVFLCYKYAAKQMISQHRGGRIIGASSVAGKQGEPLLSAYSSSKFAVRGLTQAAAIELGKYGITVNAYAPGAIDTNMLYSIGETIGDPSGFYDIESKKAAVGHIGATEDVASLVSYLASKEARFITGQSVSVNGGRFFD